MRIIMVAGFFWCCMLLSYVSFGQNPSSGSNHILFNDFFWENPPLGVMPMQFNGSFAGEAGAPRLSSNSSFYWNRNSYGKIRQYKSELSYDQFIPAIRSGVGLTVGGDKWGDKYFRENNEGQFNYVSLALAPKISIKGKYTLSPSASVQYYKYSMVSEEPPSTQATLRAEGVESLVGLLWNTPKYYIGYSINAFIHRELNGYIIDYDGIKRPVVNHEPLYYFASFFQVGYTFQRSKESNFSVTPQLVFRVFHYRRDLLNHSINFLIDYNLNFRYKKFIWGVNNAGIHVGLQTERLRIMMTNDNGTFNDLYRSIYPNYNRHYIGNLSLRYLFKDPSR